VRPGSSGSQLRSDVGAALLDLGVHPLDATSRERVREFVNDLYTLELRRLRARMLRGDFPKREYAGRVELLRRRRYWILSLPIDQWSDPPA
jgi:hypothetical protein